MKAVYHYFMHSRTQNIQFSYVSNFSMWKIVILDVA